MRILVAGPFPPAPDPGALEVLGLVRRLLAEGHDVTVQSPNPSAAERSGPLSGLRGAMGLARDSRRFDALYLKVGRFMLFRPELPQARRVFDSVALAMALRAWRRTSVDVGDLSDVPGGGGGLSGRLIWSSVDEIVVPADSVRGHVVKVLRFPAAKVKVVRPEGGSTEAARTLPTAGAGAPASPPWRVDGPADWQALMDQVRQRAASQRRDLAPAPDASSTELAAPTR